MRRRVKFATNFVNSVQNIKVGEDLVFDANGLEVIDKGLEFMQDSLRDSTTEAMWEYERKFRDQPCVHFTHSEFTAMREAVEKAIDKSDVAAELLKEFRALGR